MTVANIALYLMLFLVPVAMVIVVAHLFRMPCCKKCKEEMKNKIK